MLKGKHVVIEGIDGTGKSTAVALLKTALEAKGRKVQVVNILKDHPVSLGIRTIVTGVGNEIHPDSEACFYAGAVLNTTHLVIQPLLDAGVDVISDRGFLSTLVYQGNAQLLAGNPKPLQLLTQAYAGNCGVVPDVVLFLRGDPTVGLARVMARDTTLDRIEARGLAYQAQVQDAYVEAIAKYCSKAQVHTYVNEGTLGELQEFIDKVTLTM